MNIQWDDESKQPKNIIWDEPKKSLLQKITTPLLGEERIRRSPGLSMAAQTMPTSTMLLGPALSQAIPPLFRQTYGARELSEQTSPLAIASNALLLGTVPEIQGVVKTGTKQLLKRMPRVMGKDYTLAHANLGAEAIDETRSLLGNKIKGVLAKSDKIVDVQNLNKSLPPLPQNIASAIGDPMYGIKRLPDGSLDPSIQNMQRVKEALDDFMSTKSWNEASKMSQKVVKRAYGIISQAMKQADPNLVGPMADYSKFMKIFRKVNPTVRDVAGEVVEKPLRGVFKPGAERKTQVAWEKLSEMNPKAAQVVKNMKKFIGRQATKSATAKGLGIATAGTVGAMGLNWLIKKAAGR